VLGVLLAVGALSVVVAGVQQPAAGRGQAAPRMVTVQKVRDNLYVLGGGGGNTAVFIAANGVTLVDTKNPGWGQPILEQVRKLTDRPVTMIINTHTHFDHVSGNVEFPATVEVVTHVNTASNMEKMATPSGFAAPAGGATNIFKENGGRGMPKRTYESTLTLGRGADEINLYYFGRGHTNGDTWVVFPSLRVMHAGDIFSGKNIPLLDGNNGGSGVAIPDSLLKAANTVSVDSIITGHSMLMTTADLVEYAEFNREFLAAVQAGKQAGQTVDQIATSWKVPAKYAGYAAPQAARLRANVQVIFDELP
jgi:glyoxylase-like metal-dependent hydrolase (beta-lactamase superfamily II)